MKIFTICGSMRFKKEMQEISYYLETKKGYNILQCIYVLNIDGYIGESVRKEIAYAQLHGKEIIYHCN